ncbi:MAG: hypothetical protein ACREP5_09235, partial [Candidatus Binatia bacterium]
MNRIEDVEKRILETTLGNGFQDCGSALKELYVAHVGVGNFDSNIENVLQERARVVSLYQSRAELLQARHRRQFGGQLFIERGDFIFRPLSFHE